MRQRAGNGSLQHPSAAAAQEGELTNAGVDVSSVREHQDFLFDVWRSVRYHDKREAFFSEHGKRCSLHLVSFWLCGSIDYCWRFVVRMGRLDEIFGSLDRGHVFWGYAGFSRRCESQSAQDSQATVYFIGTQAHFLWANQANMLKRLKRERLKIESEELPILHVLDTAYYNELIHAMDLDQSPHPRTDLASADVQTRRLYS